jgi:ABC-2 type transport system ATP-binding protein
MEYVLQTHGLTKTYSGKRAVDQLTMNIERGDIYGFIGKNGAGKTTLIRMVMGLAKPTSGTMELFGSKNLLKQRSKLGTVIEYPAVFPHMTARDNLMTQCKLLGIRDLSVIDRTLKMVGLQDTGKKKARNFSLGMKQRLAIAIALIGEPEFLFLDEPINGLDPAGIKEIRDLILMLNQEKGITVLISSHILGELEKLATRYGIIDSGRLIDEFSAEELQRRCQSYLKMTVDQPQKACELLQQSCGVESVSIQNEQTILIYDHYEEPGLLNARLNQQGILVSGISLHHTNLEEYFIQATGGMQA